MAHDRCSATVEDLLDQEEDLEEALLEELREQQSVNRYECEYDHHGYASREYLYPDIKDSSYCDSYSYPYAYPYPYPYSQERRPSAVDVAI